MKKIKNFIPSGDEKAFVYQQTQDLVSSLSDIVAPISVSLEKKINSKPTVYIVTFTLGLVPVTLQARSEGQDLLEVCMLAKNEMKKKMSILAQSMEDSPQRNQLIERLKKSPYLH